MLDRTVPSVNPPPCKIARASHDRTHKRRRKLQRNVHALCCNNGNKSNWSNKGSSGNGNSNGNDNGIVLRMFCGMFLSRRSCRLYLLGKASHMCWAEPQHDDGEVCFGGNDSEVLVTIAARRGLV